MIQAFEIVNSGIGTPATYLAQVLFNVSSSDGRILDGGALTVVDSGENPVYAVILSPTPGATFVRNLETIGTYHGEFVLANAVPEPSTLLLAGTAAAVGLALWAHRRRG